MTGTEANGKHVENISVTIVSSSAWFSEGLLEAGFFKRGRYTRIRAAMNTVENTSFDLLEKHSTDYKQDYFIQQGLLKMSLKNGCINTGQYC